MSALAPQEEKDIHSSLHDVANSIELLNTTIKSSSYEEKTFKQPIAEPNDTVIDIYSQKRQSTVKPSKYLLDLGWGLQSIDLRNPYDKEYPTVAYALISFILAALAVILDNFPAVITFSVINVLLQCSLFAWCVYRYKYGNMSQDVKHLSLSVNDSRIDRSDSISPLTKNYKKFGFNIVEIEKKRKKRKKKNIPNKKKKFPIDSFLESFDKTFGREDDQVRIRPYYFRFTMVLYGIISSIYTLFVILVYTDSPLNICPTSYGIDLYQYYHKDWVHPGYTEFIAANDPVKCTRTVFLFDSCSIPWIYWIIFSLFDLYELKKEYYDNVRGITEKALKTFKNSNIIEDLFIRAEDRIDDEVKLKMKLESNRILFIFFILIGWTFLFFSRFLLGFSYYFAMVMFSLFESILYATLAMSLVKICILARYPVTLSYLFGEPIYCETTGDVLAWWQLRHIFLTYRMPIYIKILSPVISYGFILIIILPFCAIFLVIGNPLIIFSITILFVVLISFCMKQFVRAYEKRLKHIGMLQKEVIRLQANRNEFKDLKDLIKLLIEHMTQFDVPISIAGIPMTNAVFTILRGAIGAIALVIIAEAVSAY